MEPPSKLGITILGIAVAFLLFYIMASPAKSADGASEPYFLRHTAQYPEGPATGDVWMFDLKSCMEYLPRFRKEEEGSKYPLIESYCISVADAEAERLGNIEGPDECDNCEVKP
jgi:hypothetical protein